MEPFALLKIAKALDVADYSLRSIAAAVCELQAETHGAYPPAAEQVLANIQAVREALRDLLPDACVEALEAEQEAYERDLDPGGTR